MSPPTTTKSQVGRARAKNCHSLSLARPLSPPPWTTWIARSIGEHHMVGNTLGEVSWKRFRLTENPSSTLSHLFGRVILRLDLSAAVNLNYDRLSVSPTFSLPFSLSVRLLSPPSYHVLLTMEEEEAAATTTDGAALVRSPPRTARALTRPPARPPARSLKCL